MYRIELEGMSCNVFCPVSTFDEIIEKYFLFLPES
jgi:hypothetical protein